jgi:hypothetical protein
MRLFILIILISSSAVFAFNSRDSHLDEYARAVYGRLDLRRENLSFKVFKYALIGQRNLINLFYGLINEKLLTIIDYSKSSNVKRMYVIDLIDEKLLYRVLVSHAKNTGDEFARHFSNVYGSNKSSLGFYVTLNTYFGRHGLSLRLEGVESGFNDNAYDRAIVMHGADYVSREFIDRYGRLGRSLGCPAIPLTYIEEIIPMIASNSVLFIFYPDISYLNESQLIRHIPVF